MDESYIFKDIGRKIKVFRKLKNISQFDLELSTGMSTGSISRIENGETNPSKETIYKLASKLGLNNLELQYLTGNIAQPATIEEIEYARNAVKDYYKKPGVLSYMVDERSRLIDASDSFFKLFNIPLEEKKTYLMKFYHQIIFDRSLGVRNYLDDSAFHKVVFNTFCRTYSEMYFMEGDPIYEEFLAIINNDLEISQVWEEAKKAKDDVTFRANEERAVFFNFKGLRIKTIYSVEPLWGNHRFVLLHYDTPNPLIKLFKKTGII